MTVVAGPFFAAAALLGAAGALKVVRPRSTVDALRSASLPGTRSGAGPLAAPWAGRLLGLGELAVAVAALGFGGRAAAALVFAAYLGFALFTARLLRVAEAGAPCGCFGAEDSPARPLHVLVNAMIAATAAAAVAWPTPGLRAVLAEQPGRGLPFLGLTAMCGWLLFVMLTVVPDLQSVMSADSSGVVQATAQLDGRPGNRAVQS